MSRVNPYLAQNTAGFSNAPNYAGAADNKARVQLLIDQISLEDADPTTGAAFVRFPHLDKMQPEARDALYLNLVALKAAIANVV
jgi:hypothetical protein